MTRTAISPRFATKTGERATSFDWCPSLVGWGKFHGDGENFTFPWSGRSGACSLMLTGSCGSECPEGAVGIDAEDAHVGAVLIAPRSGAPGSEEQPLAQLRMNDSRSSLLSEVLKLGGSHESLQKNSMLNLMPMIMRWVSPLVSRCLQRIPAAEMSVDEQIVGCLSESTPCHLPPRRASSRGSRAECEFWPARSAIPLAFRGLDHERESQCVIGKTARRVHRAPTLLVNLFCSTVLFPSSVVDSSLSRMRAR